LDVWQSIGPIKVKGSAPRFSFDALRRASRAEIAAFAAVVDAIDERAETFYQRHDFINFGSRPRQLFLPLATFLAGERSRTDK
jgi:hypothetical protein